jgi:hypothetical protein
MCLLTKRTTFTDRVMTDLLGTTSITSTAASGVAGKVPAGQPSRAGHAVSVLSCRRRQRPRSRGPLGVPPVASRAATHVARLRPPSRAARHLPSMSAAL